MKNIVILGSTGSIGKQTLEIACKFPDLFRIVGLATHQNVGLLKKQIKKVRPRRVVVTEDAAGKKLKTELGNFPVSIAVGYDKLSELASWDRADVVVNSLVGSIGLDSTIAAIEAEKTLALANKESMVIGGEIVNKLEKQMTVRIIPVDSEHSAVFQCLLGENSKEVKRIFLTSSGGPFRGKALLELKKVTVKAALAHPRWEMGKKISIDSATLMNKGLEVIEAHFLFGLEYHQIEVLVHPQSIVHSLVEFADGSLKAHLGPTDMRFPIQYALSFPKRLKSFLPPLDLKEVGTLTFEEPDKANFPCLSYAIEAGKRGKTYPAVLNAANEVAVDAFLKKEIFFTQIPNLIYQCLENHKPWQALEIESIKEADRWAREETRRLIYGSSKEVK